MNRPLVERGTSLSSLFFSPNREPVHRLLSDGVLDLRVKYSMFPSIRTLQFNIAITLLSVVTRSLKCGPEKIYLVLKI